MGKTWADGGLKVDSRCAKKTVRGIGVVISCRHGNIHSRLRAIAIELWQNRPRTPNQWSPNGSIGVRIESPRYAHAANYL